MGYQCLQERDGSNNVTRSYVWDGVSPGGIGGLLSMKYSGAWYDYLYDGKGNVAAVVDGSGNFVAKYRYDEFGVLSAESGTLDQPYRFSTKRYYDGFGILYYGYRFYEPAIGRWLTRDPIGIAGGLNLYGFVGNSAVNLADIYGYSPADFAREADAYLYEEQAEFEKGDNGPWYTPTFWIMVAGGMMYDIAHGTVNLLYFGEGFAEYYISGNPYAFWEDIGRGSGLALILAGPAEGAVNGLRSCPKANNFNPFKGKTPQEINNMLIEKGFVPKGPDPITGKGSYINPKTGRKYYLDPGGSYRKGVEAPHVDVHRPDGSTMPKRKFPL